MVVAGLVGFVVEGADRPADPYLSPTVVLPSAVAPFGQIGIQLQPGPGQRARPGPRSCVLLADTPAQRHHRLSVDPGPLGYAGLLLAWSAPTTEGAVSPGPGLPAVAWFDGAGQWLGRADFAPCVVPGTCSGRPPAGPSRPYRFALEAPAGELAVLGAGPGTTLVVGGACPPPAAAGG